MARLAGSVKAASRAIPSSYRHSRWESPSNLRSSGRRARYKVFHAVLPISLSRHSLALFILGFHPVKGERKNPGALPQKKKKRIV